MIVGVGLDLLDISRVERLWHRGLGERLMARVLTLNERALVSGRQERIVEFVAGRFAAKEAVAKALGVGIGRQVGFHDIEILRNNAGKPVCVLSAQAEERLREAGWCPPWRIHLSISHSQAMAGAYVVIEKAADEMS